jgi:hypothetical protein
MSNAILYRAPFGVQGDITRPSQQNVEAWGFNSANVFAQYGVPGKIVSGLFVPCVAAGDVSLIWGFLVRPYPISPLNASDALGTSVPNCTAGFVANVLRRGYLNVFVQLNAASVAAGGSVYMRTAGAIAGQILGGIEGATTGNNTVLTASQGLAGGIVFTGPADANGIAEIAFNL